MYYTIHILQIKKLRLREGKQFPKITNQEVAEPEFTSTQPAFRVYWS